jgi:multiple sugar transport system substrate-binding protein
MSRVLSRRHFTLAAAALAAPALLPWGALASDVRIDLVHPFRGADHPVRKLIEAFNDKDIGVRVSSRPQRAATLAATTAGRGPALMATNWQFADFARRSLRAGDFRRIFGASRTEALLSRFQPQVRPLASVAGAPIALPWSISALSFQSNRTAADPGGSVTVGQLRPLLRKFQDQTPPRLQYAAGEWLPQALIRNAGGALIPVGDTSESTNPAVRRVENLTPSRGDSLWRVLSIPQMMASLSGSDRRQNAEGNFLAVYSKVREQQEGAYAFMDFATSREGFAIWLESGFLNVTTYDFPVRPGNEAAQAQLDSKMPGRTTGPGVCSLGALTAHVEAVQRLIAA